MAVPASKGNAAAGSSYFPVEFTNTSAAACTLFGYPGVSFVSGIGGSQIGIAATENPTVSRKLITLSPGQTVHAELQVVDRNDQPSNPKVIRGRSAIGEYFADVCGRDMTHEIRRLVVSGDNAAFVQACRYPSGAQVLCIAVLDLKDGLIIRQSGVQAWDE